MTELEEAVGSLKGAQWGGAPFPGDVVIDAAKAREGVASLTRAIALIQQLMDERGRYRVALEQIACWDQGEVGPEHEEPRAARIAREALGRDKP